ncbi:MAG TPA: phosphate ABC transporter permease subunit PstC [Anaeromyxobacter sp.]|nr:phosphate ABC transporter permease subunit PstC [Anaeromyxobacter sp.]
MRVTDLGDRLWATGLTAVGGGILLVAGLVVVVLTRTAAPAVAQIGILRFVGGEDWDPVSSHFGALPFIYGTVVTSVLAIVLALPVSVGLALFLAEMGPPSLRRPVSFAVETLAAIPSVVYGLWGLFVLVPVLRNPVEPFLGRWLGFLPLFRGPPIGLGFLAAGVILAVMILPTIASVTLDVLRTVPPALREGALALGATRWEMIRLAVLPYARPGIVGATLLGLGRALGETMAVAMVIGNAPEIRASLFAPGYTLPAVLANEFSEATSATHIGALAGLGLVLFGITVLFNAVARILLVVTTRRVARGHA